MTHALLGIGIYILPWRLSVMLLALITLTAGIGAAVIATALVGWGLFLVGCWRYG